MKADEELTLKSAVEFAVKTERQGAKLYSWLAKLFTEQQELQEIFVALAHDEVAHAERFATLLETLDDQPAQVDEDQQQYMRALFNSEVFFLFKNIEKIQDRDDALERALHLEKSTLLGYQAIRDVLGGAPVLDAIIAEEKQHVIKIMTYLISGGKMRGLEDDYP